VSLTLPRGDGEACNTRSAEGKQKVKSGGGVLPPPNDTKSKSVRQQGEEPMPLKRKRVDGGQESKAKKHTPIHPSTPRFENMNAQSQAHVKKLRRPAPHTTAADRIEQPKIQPTPPQR